MDPLVRFSDINQSKPFDFHLILSNQKVAELVKRLDLLSIKKVSLVGILSPLSIDAWSLKAELRATVKQKCVISFKPVKTIVCEPINRIFSTSALQNTFEAEVVEDKTPVVEEKLEQEEAKTEEEPKKDSKEKYSKNIQKRFDEYAYQLGESRRREEEAIKIAQAIKSERDKIQEELYKLNTGYVGAEGGRIESSMEAAKAKLKKAMDDQDSDAMAAAQLEIGKLGSDQARYEQLKSQQEALANAPKQQKEVEIPKVQNQEPVRTQKQKRGLLIMSGLVEIRS